MTNTPSPATWRHDLAFWPLPLRTQWGLAANAALAADPSLSWQVAEYRAWLSLSAFAARWEEEHPDRPIQYGPSGEPSDTTPGFVFPAWDDLLDPATYAAFWVAIAEYNASLPELDWDAAIPEKHGHKHRWYHVPVKGAKKKAKVIVADHPSLHLGGNGTAGVAVGAENSSSPAAVAAVEGGGKEEVSVGQSVTETSPDPSPAPVEPAPLEVAAAVIAEVAAGEVPPARVIRIVPEPPKAVAKPNGKGKKVNPTGMFNFGE
jgi:hypothetical protein